MSFPGAKRGSVRGTSKEPEVRPRVENSFSWGACTQKGMTIEPSRIARTYVPRDSGEVLFHCAAVTVKHLNDATITHFRDRHVPSCQHCNHMSSASETKHGLRGSVISQSIRIREGLVCNRLVCRLELLPPQQFRKNTLTIICLNMHACA